MASHADSIQEIQFSWRHDCPFNRLTEDVSGLDIRWKEPAVGVDDRTVLSRFVVETPAKGTIDRVGTDLAEHPSVHRVERTDDRMFTCILDREIITMPPELLSECLSVSIHEHDGIEEWRILTPSSRVEQFLFETLNNASGARFDLERKVPLDDFSRDEETMRDRLTDKQERALAEGLRRGYFEYPRESTAEEVADDLGITASSFTSRVRRGQRRIVEAIFDSGAN